MSQTIKLKRGLELSRPNITPVDGELIYTTDNLEVFFGNGLAPGGTEIGYLNTRTGGEVNGKTTINSTLTIAAGDSDTNVFEVLDSAGAGLFEVTETGDAVIGGKLVVNGAGQSSFAGDVLIGGSLSVNGDATVAVDMLADTLTLTGNLQVDGNTTLGNEVTDTVTINGVTSINGNTSIVGDLTVTGTTTTVNSNEVNIGDAIILLNSDETGAPTQNGGIEIQRGTADNVALFWNETADAWYITKDATDATGPDSTNVRILDTDDLDSLTNSLTDQSLDQHSDTTFTNVATSDMIMWSGTAWVNSNTVDGGTF
jgi:hypothetical protein